MVNHDGWTCPTCRRNYAPWMPSCSCINSAVGVNTTSITITPHADDTAYWRLSVHVENALAPVLGYEYDEAVGWNVGEHTAESLAMAAASRIAELIAYLEKVERWEADLILSNSSWSTGLPTLTQELFDRWIELQGERNELLARYREARS